MFYFCQGGLGWVTVLIPSGAELGGLLPVILSGLSLCFRISGDLLPQLCWNHHPEMIPKISLFSPLQGGAPSSCYTWTYGGPYKLGLLHPRQNPFAVSKKVPNAMNFHRAILLPMLLGFEKQLGWGVGGGIFLDPKKGERNQQHPKKTRWFGSDDFSGTQVGVILSFRLLVLRSVRGLSFKF